MIAVTNLTDAANQVVTVDLADGSTVTLTFQYRGATQRWTVSATRGAKTFNGLDLCVHPNLLRPWRRVAPFGLAVVSRDGADPFDINDFLSGRITVYVLDNTGDQRDVDECEETVYGGFATA